MRDPSPHRCEFAKKSGGYASTTARRCFRNDNSDRRVPGPREPARGRLTLLREISPLLFGFRCRPRSQLLTRARQRRRQPIRRRLASRVPDFVLPYPSDEAISMRDVQPVSKACETGRRQVVGPTDRCWRSERAILFMGSIGGAYGLAASFIKELAGPRRASGNRKLLTGFL